MNDDFTLRIFFSSTFYFFYFDLQSYGCKRPFRVYSLVKDPLNGDQIHVLGHWSWPAFLSKLENEKLQHVYIYIIQH